MYAALGRGAYESLYAALGLGAWGLESGASLGLGAWVRLCAHAALRRGLHVCSRGA